MVKAVVIGDDLTGSNATGSLYARQGLKAVTVSTLEAAARVARDVDVLVFTSDSRHLPAAEAAPRVRHVVMGLADYDAQIAKRVDTTLRGNVGAESEAALTALRAMFPQRHYVGLVVPAFPASGRTTVGGIQLINGEPIANSFAAVDPFTPVTDSDVARVLAQQSSLSSVRIDIHQVRTDVSSALRSAAITADFIIADAITDDDISLIAEAAAALQRDDGIRWLIVDTGPMGARFAQAQHLRSEGHDEAILVVAGSLTEQTQEQLDHLQRHLGARLLTVHPDTDPVMDVVTLLEEWQQQGSGILGVRTRALEHSAAPDAEASRMLTYLTEVTRQATDRLRPAGIYATGGDVARQSIEALGAHGFRIDQEVLPLAVSGVLVGGPYDGLGFATKGGLIGGPEAATACVHALQLKARGQIPKNSLCPSSSNERYQHMSDISVLGVTVGDPAGIGPEICLGTVTRPELRAQARSVLYADPAIIRRAADVLQLDVEVRVIENPNDASEDPHVVDVIDLGMITDADQIEFGKVQELAGRAAITSIERAVADAMDGRTAGIVTGPINKEAIWLTGSTFLGHTEMLQDLTRAQKTDTMFVVGDLCVFFATRHMSLLQAVQAIKSDLIQGSITRALKALEVFGYEQPRLAVAALNPHGGENGHFGREEIDEIMPAIAQVKQDTGATITGPVPADAVFHQGLQGAYDGIVSLYHDQGHIATKTYSFDETISVTVGLPILRTSVDHGTAFDIAGTGKASPATMISAFQAGAKFSARNAAIRAAYGH